MTTTTAVLQALALFLSAVWSAIQAYEARPKVWRVLLSALVAVFLAVLAWNRLAPVL